MHITSGNVVSLGIHMFESVGYELIVSAKELYVRETGKEESQVGPFHYRHYRLEKLTMKPAVNLQILTH